MAQQEYDNAVDLLVYAPHTHIAVAGVRRRGNRKAV